MFGGGATVPLKLGGQGTIKNGIGATSGALWTARTDIGGPAPLNGVLSQLAPGVTLQRTGEPMRRIGRVALEASIAEEICGVVSDIGFFRCTEGNKEEKPRNRKNNQMLGKGGRGGGERRRGRHT